MRPPGRPRGLELQVSEGCGNGKRSLSTRHQVVGIARDAVMHSTAVRERSGDDFGLSWVIVAAYSPGLVV